jgi:hypothetical protein
MSQPLDTLEQQIAACDAIADRASKAPFDRKDYPALGEVAQMVATLARIISAGLRDAGSAYQNEPRD